MRNFIFYFLSLLAGVHANAQSRLPLSLDSCYVLARKNYPLLKQLALIDNTASYNIENAAKGFWPQVNIAGQATYQSEVTSLPIKIPGTSVPTVSKDQYKLYAEVNQLLYDGGAIKTQKQKELANANIEKQKTEIELYQLKERMNGFFFSILLVDEQLRQNQLIKKDIDLGLQKMRALVANGTALKTNITVLQAEALKADQRDIELNAIRKANLDMLGIFINQSLDSNCILERPKFIPLQTQVNSRPELQLFNYQHVSMDVMLKMIKTKNQPRVSVFVQGGLGRPALNFLDNDIKPYYLGGLRVAFPITNFYTAKNERATIAINKRSIDIQKENFLFNTNLQVKQQEAAANKFEKLLATDNALIQLRNSIKNTSLAQLQNGIINSNDYLREVNAEDQAIQNKILHELQLLQLQYTNLSTTGN